MNNLNQIEWLFQPLCWRASDSVVESKVDGVGTACVDTVLVRPPFCCKNSNPPKESKKKKENKKLELIWYTSYDKDLQNKHNHLT